MKRMNRHLHNLLYSVIKDHPTTAKLYEKYLFEEGIPKEDLDQIKKDAKQYLEKSFQETKEQKITIQIDTMKGVWASYSKDPLDSQPATELLAEQEKSILKAITTIPDTFKPNSKLVKLLENRYKMGIGEMPIDWGFAEAMSLGSILENGFHIRFAGQDAQRGTFHIDMRFW